MAIAFSLADAPRPAERVGVLLLAYGAPASLDDVEPYLLDVRGGRATPPALVAEVRARYAAIGGSSPLLERTLAQARALARALEGIPVHVGMRHWHPRIRDVLGEMGAAGIGRVVVVPLAPHYSRLSVGAYQRSVAEAGGSPEIAFVPGWHDHPLFLDAVAQRIRAALRRFEAARRERVVLLFTAHSLPERIVAEGDPYKYQLEASVAGVLARLGACESRLAFQSAGRSDERWLGPAAAEVLEELAAAGARDVLLCPIGFVSDHLEVLYDVDVEYQRLARRLGLRLERTESLNSCPKLVAALADLVRGSMRASGWEPSCV